MVSVEQPFAIGNRVIVVANEYFQRETLDLVGSTGRVWQVYSYPIDRIMDCGVMLNDDGEPRSIPPSALARLDPEACPGSGCCDGVTGECLAVCSGCQTCEHGIRVPDPTADGQCCDRDANGA